MAAILSHNDEVEDYWMVSNPKGVREFDDIVVRINFKDKTRESIAIFIQLKLSPNKILKLDKSNDSNPEQRPNI